ncbi:MAG: hypothetical protein HC933_17320, partial [Pleurocapsa sp. SU_196_0]|nr:hypothetical protein [Pleurocapsa sp. SU_196_0]
MIFPDFLVTTKQGDQVLRTEYAGVSIKFDLEYGKSAEYTVTFTEQAVDILESGAFKFGVVLADLKMGNSEKLHRIARNAFIWDDDFRSDKSGVDYTVTANGCSQYLRESGKRTLKLNAGNYA